MTGQELARGGVGCRRCGHAQEVTGNVAKIYRYYGISRQAYYWEVLNGQSAP